MHFCHVLADTCSIAIISTVALLYYACSYIMLASYPGPESEPRFEAAPVHMHDLAMMVLGNLSINRIIALNNQSGIGLNRW